MKKAATNLGASVRQRLLNIARQRGEDSDLVLTRFALEGLLYRLSVSRHADRFVQGRHARRRLDGMDLTGRDPRHRSKPYESRIEIRIRMRYLTQ